MGGYAGLENFTNIGFYQRNRIILQVLTSPVAEAWEWFNPTQWGNAPDS
jgi:hypothetical protein